MNFASKSGGRRRGRRSRRWRRHRRKSNSRTSMTSNPTTQPGEGNLRERAADSSAEEGRAPSKALARSTVERVKGIEPSCSFTCRHSLTDPSIQRLVSWLSKIRDQRAIHQREDVELSGISYRKASSHLCM